MLLYASFFNTIDEVSGRCFWRCRRYRASDIERELGCDRHSLILLAHLLGSDYTTGVYGVGVVNSVEVLDAFDCKSKRDSGLREFAAWVATRTPL
jgi:DNA excision repair protein ERCC-5